MKTFASVLVAVVASTACKQSASSDRSAPAKAVEPPAPAEAAKAVAAKPARHPLAPFDVAATTIDPATLFPGATFSVEKPTEGVIMPDEVDIMFREPTLVVAGPGGDPLALVTLDGAKASKVKVLTRDLALGELAAADAPAACREPMFTIECATASGLRLVVDGTAPKVEEFTVAAAKSTVVLAAIYEWPADKRPTVVLPK